MVEETISQPTDQQILIGKLLRDAREAKGIAIEDMAEKLHLLTDVVRGIEQCDFEEMPSRVFVRGYVRNYARLVGLNAQEMLDKFDQAHPEDLSHLQIDKSPHLPTDSPVASRFAGVMTWVTVLAIVILFVVWWYGYLTREEAKEITVEQSVETEEVTVQAPVELVPQVESLTPPVLAIETIEEAQAALPKNELTEPKIALPTEAALVDSVIEAQPIVAEPLFIEPAQALVIEEKPVEVVEAQPQVPAVPDVRLKLNGDCWVIVKSDDDSFKLVGLYNTGYEKIFEGNAPYTIVLGNYESAELWVRGELYDLTPHARGNVARFTLTL
jgi:cytoskeleton protein RodZ